MIPPTLSDLRRYAIARSLFKPTTLAKAIAKLGFVQADPIRAPARAQDLTLRHRVAGYRAGDLERRYPRLPIEEDFFVNYGFVPREVHTLMHPRTARQVWTKARWQQAHAVLDFVREHGVVHPREVDAHFAHGKVTNWFGGSSNASTQLLDGMHYRGLLRIARREGGVRLYAAREADAGASGPGSDDGRAGRHRRRTSTRRCRRATLSQLRQAPAATRCRSGATRARLRWRARRRACRSATVDGHTWYWPAGENPRSRRHRVRDEVRLLAPFDPVVWDRRRFEIVLGLGVSLRGVHAGAETRARLLRAAADCGATRSSAGGICR